MKKQLLFLLLLIVGIGNAQIADIPDNTFKEHLLSSTVDNGGAKDSEGNPMTVDANNDGEIQIDEALAVWELNFGDAGVDVSTVEGIEELSNLNKLVLTGLSLHNADISGLPNLKHLDLEMLNLLETLVLPESLETINCLDYLGISIASLTELDVSGLVNLKTVTVKHFVELELDFSNSLLLETLYIDGNSSTVILGNKPLLTDLYIKGEPSQEYLDLSECTALENLEIVHYLFSSSINPDYPRYLRLNNGINNYETIILNLYSTSESPLYICIDEGNESIIPSDPNIFISSYCNFTPGGNYNTIAGNFTFDGDNNGCDTSDNFSTMVKVNINDGAESGSTFSNNNGNYNFYTESGTFTLTPQFENDWFTITPSSATVTFEDDNNNIETQSFCVTPNGEHPDVEVVIVPTEPAQPGFNASYKITYRNKGNQTVSGNIFLTYDETVLDYVSSTSGVGASTNTFGWSYTDLEPFETRNIYLTLKVNAPTDTPAVNIDDVLMFTANVTVAADNDENPDDNTFILAQTVVGSFDPNDITCLEGEAVHVDKIGEYLHYNINFENTGTAPATFIVVKNEINEEQFDINTLQLMDASHNVETRISGNTVEFYFGDINLAANGGKGNVLFKIKTLDTLQEDDIVMQEANIYFDYNFPIETNEANTTFAVLSNNVLIKDYSVKLYPNPTTNNVTIAANSAITSVQLYDIQGRLLHSRVGNETSIRLDVSAQPSGLYFVKITTDNGSKVEKLVKE